MQSADGSLLEIISPKRFKRLLDNNSFRSVKYNRKGEPLIAIRHRLDSESVLDRVPVNPYSYRQRIKEWRVWQHIKISDKDRPVFQTSVTDNLVYVDPATGEKRAAA